MRGQNGFLVVCSLLKFDSVLGKMFMENARCEVSVMNFVMVCHCLASYIQMNLHPFLSFSYVGYNMAR